MTEYIINHDPSACYGCRACEHICQENAISMQPNLEGFLYPVMDENKCIKCGLCTSVCPHDKQSQDEEMPKRVYAVQAKDIDILMRSSSGGAFSVIANYILENDGYVCGCIFSDRYEAVHILTRNRTDVDRMRGSKYVQSNTKDVYPRVKELLNEGRLVLFTGTPCQVAGLKGFLQGGHQNLFPST